MLLGQWRNKRKSEVRASQSKAMPKTPLGWEHVENCHVLPNRKALVEAMPKDAVVAEIGVARGGFSSVILEHSRPRKLHLIDLWQGRRYRVGSQIIADKFRAEIDQGQVCVNVGLSTEALAEFPDGHFDWVYIDTDHTYSTTLQELQLCAKKVKSGGYITGHDFSPGNPVKPVVYGVIPACHEFCVRFGWQYAYLTIEAGSNFSFALERGPAPHQ